MGAFFRNIYTLYLKRCTFAGSVTILLKSKNKYGTIKEKREKNEMATTVVKCPYCGSEEVSLYGKSSTGAQRYLCRNKACSHKTFQVEYKNNASKPGTKEKIIDMAMNGAGTRDTGRVLRISPNTVTGVLKKRKNFYLSGCNPAHTSSHGCSIYSQNIPFKQLQRQGNRMLSSNRGKSWKRVIVKPVKSFTIDKKSFDLG